MSCIVRFKIKTNPNTIKTKNATFDIIEFELKNPPAAPCKLKLVFKSLGKIKNGYLEITTYEGEVLKFGYPDIITFTNVFALIIFLL